MAADNEGDSQMLSSDSEPEASTPADRTLKLSAALSPPSSQPRTSSTASASMPTSAPGTSIANSNGKRPIQTISNGSDDGEEFTATGGGKARQDGPPKVHQPSGYTWSKPEDEPGFAWLNKKAANEYQQAWDTLVHRDLLIRNRYGDPFEMAEQEKAIIASRHQT